MESISKTNTFMEKSRKMTLKGYYSTLPNPVHPKKAFIQKIALRCKVTETTVRNWVKYGIKPKNPNHVRIISEVTGIAEEYLWVD